MSCFTVHPDIRQEGPWERRGSAHFFRMDMIGAFYSWLVGLGSMVLLVASLGDLAA